MSRNALGCAMLLSLGLCQTGTLTQGLATFLYGSEYLGDFMRLVITPFLNRRMMALTTSMSMNAIGCISGAVSTGKTSIVKVLFAPWPPHLSAHVLTHHPAARLKRPLQDALGRGWTCMVCASASSELSTAQANAAG